MISDITACHFAIRVNFDFRRRLVPESTLGSLISYFLESHAWTEIILRGFFHVMVLLESQLLTHSSSHAEDSQSSVRTDGHTG